MEDGIILILNPEDVDLERLVVNVANSEEAPDIYLVNDINSYCAKRLKDDLIENGTSSVLSKELLAEVLVKPSQNPTPLIALISQKLASLSPNKSLTIVDPFFFSSGYISSSANYVQMFEQAISKIASNISEINFVTLPQSDGRFESQLHSAIVNHLKTNHSHITSKHSGTKDFHDRFWLVDDLKGLFVGTSLNSIGNKYFLVDNLKPKDAQDVVSELQKNGLI